MSMAMTSIMMMFRSIHFNPYKEDHYKHPQKLNFEIKPFKSNNSRLQTDGRREIEISTWQESYHEYIEEEEQSFLHFLSSNRGGVLANEDEQRLTPTATSFWWVPQLKSGWRMQGMQLNGVYFAATYLLLYIGVFSQHFEVFWIICSKYKYSLRLFTVREII